MSIDWIVTWPKKKYGDADTAKYMKRPDKKVIQEVLEDYLGDLCEKIVEHSPGFLSVSLRGKYSRMFQRHGAYLNFRSQDERWFEVWVHKNGITITTRMADDVTMGIAENFARRCAQRWDGELDEPS